ncbi:HpcH/HpaI aldolase family protein [Oceanobacillus salinisoli]|uniref:HpcH/HpaI aldolase family protein n=1 Tax=Oceanobacillus salinisoli TaxID=2678611 RepID=UPI0012E2A1DF|nr:aldolase/citrate lyase family protein [Oceanobacillus salinisoli]
MGLKEKMELQACVGTFLKIPRTEIVEMLALAGFDFVICDMEHAQISESEAREVIRAAVSMNMDVTVRLPDASQGLVNRLLEAGASGIQIPRLKRSADIQHLYSVMKYPPKGTRSVGNANLQAGYGSINLVDYLNSENERVITIGQFETKEMEQPYENLFEELDVAFIGPTDLCVDFGVPGNLDHPEVQARLQLIEDMAKQTDTVLGAFAPNVDAAKRYIDRGYRYLAVGGDAGILMSAAKSTVKNVKELLNV